MVDASQAAYARSSCVSLVLLGDRDGNILASEDGGAHFAHEQMIQGGGITAFARRPNGTVLAINEHRVVARAAK